MSWRAWLAGVLLLFGVATTADAFSDGPWWLIFPGSTFLLFVVPLTIDEARR